MAARRPRRERDARDVPFQLDACGELVARRHHGGRRRDEHEGQVLGCVASVSTTLVTGMMVVLALAVVVWVVVAMVATVRIAAGDLAWLDAPSFLLRRPGRCSLEAVNDRMQAWQHDLARERRDDARDRDASSGVRGGHRADGTSSGRERIAAVARRAENQKSV